MAEDYGLTFAPIFVENLSTVFGRDAVQRAALELKRPNCSKSVNASTYWLASAADGGKRQNHIWLFSVTVQVIPAAINTPAGTLVMRMRTGMR